MIRMPLRPVKLRHSHVFFASALQVSAVILLGSCQLDIRAPLIRVPQAVDAPTITASDWNGFRNGYITITPPGIPGVQVFYSTDGGRPSTPYSAPIFLDTTGSREIRAIARLMNLDSPVAVKNYAVNNYSADFRGTVEIFVPPDDLPRSPDRLSGTIVIRGPNPNPHFRIVSPAGGTGVKPRYFYTTDGSIPRIDGSGNRLTPASTMELTRPSAPLLTSPGTHSLKVIALPRDKPPSKVITVRYRLDTAVPEEIEIDMSRLVTDGTDYYINQRLSRKSTPLITVSGPGESYQWILNGTAPDGTVPAGTAWRDIPPGGLNYAELDGTGKLDKTGVKPGNSLRIRALSAGKVMTAVPQGEAYFIVDTAPPSIPAVTFIGFVSTAASSLPSLDADTLDRPTWRISITTAGEPGSRHSWTLTGQTERYSLIGGSDTLNSESISYLLTGDDVYTITVKSQDAAGNESTVSAQFEVTAGLPSISLRPRGFSPAGGKQYLNEAGLDGNSWSIPVTTDPGAVLTWDLQFIEAGSPPERVCSGTIDRNTITLSPANLISSSGSSCVSEDGDYTLTISSKDSSGKERTVTFKFTVDTEPPAAPTIRLSGFVPAAGKKYLQRAGTGIERIEITTDRAAAHIHTARLEKIVSGKAHTKVLAKITESPSVLGRDELSLLVNTHGLGEYRFTVVSRDSAGNESEAFETFSVVETLPSR